MKCKLVHDTDSEDESDMLGRVKGKVQFSIKKGSNSIVNEHLRRIFIIDSELYELLTAGLYSSHVSINGHVETVDWCQKLFHFERHACLDRALNAARLLWPSI